MAQSMTSSLTSGLADPLIRRVADEAGVSVVAGHLENAVRVAAYHDACEIRLQLPRHPHVMQLETHTLEAVDADDLGAFMERQIRAAAAALRAAGVLSLLDRQYPIDFAGEGADAERAERAEQAAARLLEEAGRLLRQAAELRGDHRAERVAAAAEVAMDAALGERPIDALRVLHSENALPTIVEPT